MPYCNQCGSPLEPSSAQCPVCGRSNAAPVASASAGPSGVPAARHNGRRFVPIFLVGVVLLGVVLMGGVLLLYYHARKGIHTTDGTAVIEAPFGRVASGQDSLKVARHLHFPVYPGATRMDADTATEINGMGGQVATMTFVTSDPVVKVIDFYRGQFPDGIVKARSPQHGVLTIAGIHRATTIDAQWDGSQTKIDVSIVQHE